MRTFVARFLSGRAAMKQLLLFFLFVSTAMPAQTVVSGVIRDAGNGKPLPFASVSAPGQDAAIADVDGRFRIRVKQGSAITFSYTGFFPQTVTPEHRNSYYNIVLQRQHAELEAASANASVAKANSIIQVAIARKVSNDPQRALHSYRFDAYEKLLVTADPDSIDTRILQKKVSEKGRSVLKPDSANFKFAELIANRHLFEMEKASRYEYADGHQKETILGTRMSGFSQPLYEVIGFTQQSFSIYQNRYDILETTYRSPLADNAFLQYRYNLLDTATIDGRTVYVIYFKARKDSRKQPRLRGLLYIDTETYGIARAVIRIKGILDLRIGHDFTFLPGQKIWFPKTKELRITKGDNDADIRILGETLTFDASADKGKDRDRQASDYTYLESATRYFNAQYDNALSIRHTAVAIEIKDDAIKRDDAFWKAFRTQPLDARDTETYAALDSISRRRRLERKIWFGRKAINGYIPFGPVDLDLRYLLSFNNYEGFRLGLGGITNERFSRKYRLDGYAAYGTKDGEVKFSLGGAARIGKFSGTWIGANYTDDIREIASSTFAIDKRVFKLYDPRPINVSTFYGHRSWRGYIETKIIPKTESIWQLTHSEIDPLFPYTFSIDGKAYHQYAMTTGQLSLQWNPFSDYMQTPSGRMEIEKRFPKFTLQVTQSLGGLWGNDFDFAKFDFRAEYEIPYLDGQKSSLLFEAGYADGDVPLTHLYNTSPNNLTKDRLLQRVTLAGKNSFETMFFNEFFSSRYAMLQLKHGLRRIPIMRKVKPSLVFVTRMAWGSMQKPWQHDGISYKTLDEGYFESGMELNKIFSGFGLTAFYRYGPNALPRFEDNLAIKLSFSLDLGF